MTKGDLWHASGMFALAVVVAAIAAPFAGASQLIDRNAVGVKLTVNAKGEALLTYKKGGKVMRVLAWGAVDAVAPTDDAPQTELKLDYAGGWGKYYANDPAVKKLQANYQRLKRSGQPYLTSPTVKQLSAKSAFARNYATKSFGGSCPKYTGPALAWFVTACTAPDGSHWAVQSWQRALPNYGLDANATQSVWELRLSHWTTDLPAADDPDGLVVAPVGSPLRHVHLPRPARSTASPRPRPASRSTPSAATSTSTRSTRRTARAGSARTAS